MIKFNQAGQMFILSILLLTLVMVNTLLIIAGALSFKQNSKYSVDSLQAVNLAEAGIDKAVASLNASGGTYNGELETKVGNGSYEVVITSKNVSTNIVSATGYVPDKASSKAKRTISIQVSKGIGSAFNYGVQVGDGGLYMNENAKVNGSVYSNGNIVMENNAKITGDAYVAGGTQATADQQSDCNPASPGSCKDFIFGKNSNQELDVAQSFKPSCINPPTCATVINKVQIKLKKFGSPPNLTVRLLADNSGKPNKNNVLTTGTLSASLVTTSYSFVDISFTSTPTLNADTTYWVLLDTSSNSSNYWVWSMDSLQGYTRGAGLWSADWNAKNPTWSSINGDLGFKTFMGGVATSIIGSNGVTIGNTTTHLGDAHANTLKKLTIGGGAYYQTADDISANSLHPNFPDPVAQVMPLSDANIQEWKSMVDKPDTTFSGFSTCKATLATGKYIGDVILPGNCTITVGSPIWVTGNLTFGGGDTIKLAPSLGSSSGVFIVDNFITISNSNSIQGDGNAGSYLMLISEFNSRDDPQHRDAITVNNNGNTGILYSNLGGISITNNNTFTAVTAWKLSLGNNVTVNYDQGLAGVFFSSGPSGAFSVIKGTYQEK